MSEGSDAVDAASDPGGSEPEGFGCFRAVAGLVDDGVYRLNAEGRFVAADDCFLETTGYDRATVIGADASTVFEGDALERARRALRDRFEDAEAPDADDSLPLEVDLSLRTAAGAAHRCTVRHTPVATDGTFHGTLGVMVDVSGPGDSAGDRGNRYAARDPRGDSSAAASTPIGDRVAEGSMAALDEAEVGVFVLDASFEIAWINETTERYFGIDRERVVGRDKPAVIEESIRRRVADADQFTERVLATYGTNDYIERFEVRVTSPEGVERRLEHRSRPIEAGPYAGGRIELYYDVTDRHRRTVQLRRLHDAVHEWLGARSRCGAAEQATRHFDEILGLEITGVYLFDEWTRSLRPAAWSDRADALFGEIPTFEAGEGIVWRVFETGNAERYDDVRTAEDVYNPTTPIRSEIVLPIGEHGVVVTGSQTRAAFDETDMTLARVAASTLETAFDRLQNEEQLERERAQTERILQTAPFGVSVQDAEGRTLLANRRVREILGLSEGEGIGDVESREGWTVYDAEGAALKPGEGPVARVRRTGERVFDEEILVERPTGDRTWLSVNATPVFDDDGSIERVIAAGEDVTALKTHERELARRKSELETELSEILGRISDAFYALDEEWRFTHVNERAEELLGYSREELLGECVWDVFPGGTRSDLIEKYTEAMETQEAVSWERFSGSLEIWMEIQVYPSESGLSVYFRDVSERKEREQRLQESERLYRSLAERFPNGMVVRFDDDCRYTLAAGQAFDDLPYAPADLEGRRPRDVFPERVAEDVEDTFRRTLAGEELTFECVDADRDWLVRTTPLSDDAGSVVAGLALVQDITERKAYRRRLEESEQRYRTLVRHFPNGAVALFDEELRYTACGGQLLEEFAIDPEDLVGTPIHDSLRADVFDEVEPEFRATLEGDANEFELEYRGRTLVVYTLPVTDADGDVFAGMVMAQDVTDRTRYQRQLEESNERLEQFAYAASHDLQEPLRMITSYLTLLERRYGDDLDGDGAEFLAFAVDGADRMRNMIDGLLEYSRVETTGKPLEPVDLGAIIDDVRTDLQLQIEEHDARIDVETPLPRVEGDASQLRQVFQNLLTNAITYSGDEPPRIEIEAERSGTTVVVSVDDEGIGIDPDSESRIFEVFQRLHTHAEHPGTGIGLSICQRIVERHGGEIRVDSEPGEGSTFSFSLPAATEGPAR
ncbi:PAS domain-containing protein [Natrialbaceae archaeon GCM10025810]|uniref:PAS domain-containing protein n=1 Tax=Halovalidus salilacus TaxID=3075124 RepID=UPI00360A167D